MFKIIWVLKLGLWLQHLYFRKYFEIYFVTKTSFKICLDICTIRFNLCITIIRFILLSVHYGIRFLKLIFLFFQKRIKHSKSLAIYNGNL